MNESGKNPVVLIAEDESLIGSLLKLTLRKNGFDVVGPFSRPETAVDAATQTPPDVAILDYNLEAGTTSEAIAECLSDKHIPYVFLTGGGIIEGTECPNVTNAKTFVKPVKMNALIEELNALTGVGL